MQEVAHSMRIQKGRKGIIMIKIDLEKDGDRLRWEFIYDTLLDAGFPIEFVRILANSFEASNSSLIWNGQLSDPFRPTRGVRQGQLYRATYLFVLCMERLSQGINLAVENGSWRPIRLGRNSKPSTLTHIFFALRNVFRSSLI